MKKAILNLWIILLTTLVFSQSEGYQIIVSLDGYNDSIAYIGHYYGDKLTLSDTADAVKGHIVFEGDKPLKQGIYFFVTQQRKKAFEFLVDDDQMFTLQTQLNAPPTDMVIIGSEENMLFYDYLRHNMETFENARNLQAKVAKLPAGSDSIALLRAQIDSINNSSVEYKLKLMEENPDGLTTLLFTVMREPEVPDFFLDDGRQDSLAAYLYYRNHYWDGVDFSDDRILRTPVFHRKLDRYMDQVIQKHPDSVISVIDNMISQTGDNSEMKEYLLWYFASKYETSKVMGYDRIFVHVVDEYFTNQTYDWLNPVVQQNLIKRVDVLRNLLIGEFAPALIMADTNNEFISLHQLEADYVIIMFWTSTCGECKSEVDILKKYYNETDIDLSIYAVNTDTVISDWKNYIIKKKLDWVHVNGNFCLTGDYHDLYDIYSTPVIYVLDRNKKIIAKRLPAEKIPDFIRRDSTTKYDN